MRAYKKHIFLIISILMINVLNTFAQNSSSKADSLIKISMFKIDSKDYYGAMKNLNMAIRVDPTSSKAYKYRAIAKNEIKEYRSALEDAHKSVTMAKFFDAETYLLLGKIYINLNEYETAMGYINNSLNINPSYYEAMNQKALLYIYMLDYKTASEEIEKYINQKSDYGDFYFTRGVVLIYLQKYQRAISSFNRALELESTTNEFVVYLNRGIANLQLLAYEKAIRDFNEAINIDPYNASAYHSRGRAYYEMEAYDAALDDFNKSIQINPESGVTYYNMGMSYYRLHNKKNACMYFHKGCSLSSKNACKMVLQFCSGNNLEFETPDLE